MYATLVQERIKALAIHFRSKEKGRGEWLIVLAICTMVAMGGIFGGFQLDTQVINRPAQAIGICPSPDEIQGNNCVNVVCTSDSNNQQHCVSFPGGYIYSTDLNPPTVTTTTSTTSTKCTGAVCVGIHP